MGFQSGGGPRRQMGFITDEEAPDSTLGLGELAQLTVSNEAEQFGVSVSDPCFSYSRCVFACGESI